MLLLSNRTIIIIILFGVHSLILSQSTSQYYHKNPTQVEEGKDVNISVTSFISDPIISGMLFFRSIGQMSYQEIPMQYNKWQFGRWISLEET
jgi:hypothetical protein